MRSAKETAAPISVSKKAAGAKTLDQMRDQWLQPLEKTYLTQLLSTHGQVSAAAKAAGVNRVTFYRLMEKHGLTLQRTVRQQPGS